MEVQIVKENRIMVDRNRTEGLGLVQTWFERPRPYDIMGVRRTAV